jgi:hypothetical protein
MDATTVKVLTYTLHFAGLFGRNRNSKVSSKKIGEVPLAEPLAPEKIQALADAAIAEIKPKGRGEFRWQVNRIEETIEQREDGIQIRSFFVCSGETVLKGCITP